MRRGPPPAAVVRMSATASRQCVSLASPSATASYGAAASRSGSCFPFLSGAASALEQESRGTTSWRASSSSSRSLGCVRVCWTRSQSDIGAGLGAAPSAVLQRRGFLSSLFGKRRAKGRRSRMISDAYTSEVSSGLGTGSDGKTLHDHLEGSASSRTRDDLRRQPPGSTLPPEAMKDLMELGETTARTSRLGRPLPLAYDLEVRRQAKQATEAKTEVDERFRLLFDEKNMPRDPRNPNRSLEQWEMAVSPEHKSLVLLLYRNILKGLVNFKSIRRRSLIAYARLTFRRRASATEKLLIDECVEEARRALYVLGKHHAFTETRQYEYDTMTLPKDTGQDVKTYMEEVYDPEVSRSQFQQFSDVQPGKEHLHAQKLGPTSGAHHFGNDPSGSFKPTIKEEDKVLRPPPPPGMGDPRSA